MQKIDKELQDLEAKVANALSLQERDVDFSLVRKVSREFLSELERISFSETKSLYSHLPDGGRDLKLTGLKHLSSREAVALVLAVDELHPEWTALIRLELENLCYLRRYQGFWRLAHKLLKTHRLDQKIYLLIEKGYSPREIFGNFLPLSKQRLKKINVYRQAKERISYPQRKRGYNDHGSRKDDSQWLPSDIHLGPNPQKEDNRSSYKSKAKSLFNFLWS